MVGENLEIYSSEMAENTPNRPPWLEKILILSLLKCLKIPNHPPWLEKISTPPILSEHFHLPSKFFKTFSPPLKILQKSFTSPPCSLRPLVAAPLY